MLQKAPTNKKTTKRCWKLKKLLREMKDLNREIHHDHKLEQSIL